MTNASYGRKVSKGGGGLHPGGTSWDRCRNRCLGCTGGCTRWFQITPPLGVSELAGLTWLPEIPVYLTAGEDS